MPSAATSLSETVNAPLPDEFAKLSDEQLSALEEMLRAAISARAASMDTAIAASLDHAPRLARPAIRKVLGL